jgi:hypothetical protein
MRTGAFEEVEFEEGYLEAEVNVVVDTSEVGL